MPDFCPYQLERDLKIMNGLFYLVCGWLFVAALCLKLAAVWVMDTSLSPLHRLSDWLMDGILRDLE